VNLLKLGFDAQRVHLARDIFSRQMKRAWRHHRRTQRPGVPTEIDVPATVSELARIGVSNPAPLQAVISLLAKVLTNEGNGGLEASQAFRPVGSYAA
jgi:hypothetical protein